jgi:predicted nucleic acid-binding protein
VVKVVLDTNILIDFLRGIPQARAELERLRDPAISIVTWMEVMVGADRSSSEETRLFLDTFTVLQLDGAVATRAVTLRREQRLKLPDAIIRATADVHRAMLVTRNTKDFPAASPGVRHPYTL